MALATPLIILLAQILFLQNVEVASTNQFPAMFVLGDSLLDPGNNNFLPTIAKANFPPNGIDFAGGATGRFCNGRIVPDQLGALLGLPNIPAFNDPKTGGSKLLKGVNYASAASGILRDTGKNLGLCFSMDTQIAQFRLTLAELKLQIGERTKNLISQSLFFISMGNNDYLNNYLVSISDKPERYGPDDYSSLLVKEYSRQLKELYDLGARTFLIAGAAPLGCSPGEIGVHGAGSISCIEDTNKLVQEFNRKLMATIPEINRELQESKFIYWDAYTATMDIIQNFEQYGFKYPTSACCGQLICTPNTECSNRSEYIFWDGFHPTDAFIKIFVKSGYQLLQA